MTSKDFNVEYLITSENLNQAKNRRDGFSTIENSFSLLKLFASARYREVKIEPAEEQKRLQKSYNTEASEMMNTFIRSYRITPSQKPDLNLLPFGSFSIWLRFELDKPFISRDDDSFYLLDNPIKKDKVFKVPMISGSSWKGNLRWVGGKDIEFESNSRSKLNKRIQLIKLFGHEKELQSKYLDSFMPEVKGEFYKEIKHYTNKDGLRKGRIQFFPTFFAKMGLDVINPHDRKTKAGTVPVFIETVPAGTPGVFSLIYIPFDMMGQPKTFIQKEVMKDLYYIAWLLKALMLDYGFSAKKSSGFGIVKEPVSKAIITIKGIEPKEYRDFRFDDMIAWCKTRVSTGDAI